MEINMSNKKKIGIITYWESNDNYGQQLQCWALQHFLRERGYDAFLVRQYLCPPLKKRGAKRIKQVIKDSIANVLYATNLAYIPTITKYFSFCLDQEACRRQFPRFRAKELKMSKIFESPEALMDNPPQADIYITGSDQVWNYDMTRGPLANYFLQFAPQKAKRISYAPSIAHKELTNEIKPIFQKYLQTFSAISVRETSAVGMLKEIGYNAEQVLDPSMLLKADDYLRLASHARSKANVFIYSMNYATAEDIPFAQIASFAEQKELPIIVTPGSGYLPAQELFEGVEYSYATICEWIQHIACSELIVTASFHGIVFAILMHRTFLYTPLRGTYAKSNNRVLDLLNELGLEDQILVENKAIMEYSISQKKWEEVDKKLDQLIQKSTNYLMNAIND